MAVSRHALVPLGAIVMLLFAGVAQATCAAGRMDCDKNYSLNGCEVNVHTDVNNCGNCGYKCGDYCGTNVVPACSAGKCQYSCKAPFLNCDSDWKTGCEVDGSKDVNNCGACGSKCIAPPYATATCTGGKCVYICKPGWSNCDGDWTNGCEVDIGKDANNCAACGTKCKDMPNAVTKCNGGKCEYSCKPGFSNCDGDWTNGCESSTGTDTSNCGACGTKCKDMPNAVTKCNGGKCEYSCKPGFSNCDGDWTNGCESSTGTDTSNCGACGTKCKDMPNAVTKCNGGKCEYSCKPGFSNCDGDWTNGCESSTGTDTSNCGACGTKCKDMPNAVTKCNGGKCVYSCKPGFNNCDGDWTNGCEGSSGTDVNNCGACGVKCKDMPNAVTQCNGGKCVYSCKPNYANCDNNWINGCECYPGSDVNHCGGCGKQCPTPKYAGGEAKCTNGKCETQSCKGGYSWESSKKCCVSGGSGGGQGGWGGDKGGSGGDKGGSGGDKGGSGGSKGGWGGDKGGNGGRKTGWGGH
ncbi:hypothetical protein M758_2G103000 [Ceratodon purpureus]|nr:hypothetical protein M758_2G103000 [Ceratodon purpureus]